MKNVPVNSPVVDIVIADFYRDIADGLLASCREKLSAEGCTERHVLHVEGALEIPPLLKYLAEGKESRPSFMVALGCVIRGETYHFEVVSNSTAAGIMQVQLDTGIPIGNGVLTVENREQALARLDKGAGAASAALTLARHTGRVTQ